MFLPVFCTRLGVSFVFYTQKVLIKDPVFFISQCNVINVGCIQCNVQQWFTSENLGNICIYTKL